MYDIIIICSKKGVLILMSESTFLLMYDGVALNSLRISYFPNAWKLANIKPIPKPGKDLRMPANHRPISLLSALGKIFERCINSRLTNYLEDHELLNPNQFGFRAQHSTTHALATFTDFAAHQINKGRVAAAALLDATEAFPTINHTLLFEKMCKLRFPPSLINLTRSYLRNTETAPSMSP